MHTIKRLPEFMDWIGSIKDAVTRVRLNKRLDKVQRGLLGDGDKSTQQADIQAALALAEAMKE